MFLARGIYGDKARLEWLEFDSGLSIQVSRLEDIPQSKMDALVKKLS